MLKTFEQRQTDFQKVKTRILAILLDFPSGLTVGEINQEYLTRFRHSALLDNRLRELRQAQEVISIHREDCDRLIWKLNPERWNLKK